MRETSLIERQAGSGMIEVASTRQMQEVQAAVISAKRFPRDEVQAHKRIMTACSRKGLAEVAMYSYPRGGQAVTGPSIRLAEAMAQAWGNIDAGWVELERKPSLGNLPGESVVLAYAVDLETNYRKPLTFTVRHWRDTKQGGYAIKEERDIYEIVANQASRRLRACILGVIPKDVQDDAVEQCEKTLKTDKEPLIDRVKKMVMAFGEMGVSQEMIEKRLAHKMEATTDTELVGLRKIWTSIKDGFADRGEFFEVPAATTAAPAPEGAAQPDAGKVQSIKKAVKNHAPQHTKTPQPEESTPTQPAAVVAKEPEFTMDDGEITPNDIFEGEVVPVAKNLKWGNAALLNYAREEFKKGIKELTVKEMEQLAGKLLMIMKEKSDAK